MALVASRNAETQPDDAQAERRCGVVVNAFVVSLACVSGETHAQPEREVTILIGALALAMQGRKSSVGTSRIF